jgi:hypothetical protein
MTDLVDLLTHVRNHYVDMFEAALDELREKGHTLIVEPPMVDEAGELVREGVLNLGARYDLALVEGEGATPSAFSPSRMLNFTAEAFHGAGLDIVVAPFQWDNVRIAIDGEPKAIAAALGEWFEGAIAAPNDIEEGGIQRAAHFLSDPDVEGRTSIVQADLGTVDVHIVMALFDHLRLAGAARVELGLPDS